MKSKIFKIICFLFLYSITIKAQELLDTPELYFQNYSDTRSISFKIYPISLVFNGWGNYDLFARHTEFS